MMARRNRVGRSVEVAVIDRMHDAIGRVDHLDPYATISEIDRRRNRVYGLICDGYPRREIVAIVGGEYGVGASCVDSDMAAVRQDMRDAAAGIDMASAMAYSLAETERLKRLAVERGDLGVAAHCQRLMIGLRGLSDQMQAVRARIEADERRANELASMSDEQLAAYAKRLIGDGSTYAVGTGDIVYNGVDNGGDADGVSQATESCQQDAKQ